ncbi:hypothetical protein [Streptomyces lunalinharesii]
MHACTQAQNVAFGAAGLGAGFQSSDQRPPFGNRFEGVARLACDLGQSHRGLTELQYRVMICVGGIGNAENVCWQVPCFAKATSGSDVVDGAFAQFQAGRLGDGEARTSGIGLSR